MDDLIQLIRGWSARYKLQHSLYWLFFGMTVGLGLALLIAILARILPILSTTTLVAITILITVSGVIGAATWPWLHSLRSDPSDWARRFDQQFVLKERLSTALELNEGLLVTRNDAMRRQQQDDALRTAERVEIRRMLPLRVQSRFVLASLILGVVLIVIVALPNPQQQVLENRARMQQVLQEQLKQLEETRQEVQQSQALTDEQKKQIVQALEDAEQALGDPNTSPEKALAALNDAQSKLDTLRDQNLPAQSNDLQRAGQSLAPNELTNPLANALENQDFSKAADELRNLTQDNGKPLSQDQRQNAANQLEQIARNTQNSDGATAQQLQEAANQLRQGNDSEAQKLLNQAADSLGQLGQKEATDQQVNKAQTSMEAARRAVSGASDQSQTNQAQAPLSGSQSGSQAQQSASNQQSDTQGNSGSQPGAGPVANEGANAGQSPIGGAGQSQHHDDVGTDNSIYVRPERLNAAGQPVALQDESSKGVTNPNAPSNPGVNNPSSVQYQQVFPQYAKTADDAIQSGQVPMELRDYVRDYFSSLDPRQRQ